MENILPQKIPLSSASDQHYQRALQTSSAVHLYQLEQLQNLGKQRPTEETRYRGVWQRNLGKWVAEIRLPQNRIRVWLGTYNSPQAAAFAYDCAACILRGEYARLNFPELRDGHLNCKLIDLRSSVESKIKAVYKRLNQEKSTKKRTRKNKAEPTDKPPSCESSDESAIDWDFFIQEEHIGSSLVTMPSLDAEVIRQLLGN